MTFLNWLDIFGKIRRLWAQGIHLSKLIYITRGEFRFLKVLKKRFLRSAGVYKRSEKERREKRFEEKKEGESPEVKIAGRNEATRIWNTRDSLFWSWRRAKEFYRELIKRRDAGEQGTRGESNYQ